MIDFFRNQQYEHDSDRITPLGAGFDGVNFPLRKTGQNLSYWIIELPVD